MPIERVNDFVVRFANVNGSGSASANELFARSVLSYREAPSSKSGRPKWGLVTAGHR